MNEFRRCLIDLDVAAVRKIWPVIAPNRSQISSDQDALTVLHYARTQAESVPFELRAYSHKWLCERSLPSGLPDELRPSADRLYPRTVEAVGVSVKSLSEAGKPLAAAIQLAMSEAVAEAYADGRRDAPFIKARMDEARERVMRG